MPGAERKVTRTKNGSYYEKGTVNIVLIFKTVIAISAVVLIMIDNTNEETRREDSE